MFLMPQTKINNTMFSQAWSAWLCTRKQTWYIFIMRSLNEFFREGRKILSWYIWYGTIQTICIFLCIYCWICEHDDVDHHLCSPTMHFMAGHPTHIWGTLYRWIDGWTDILQMSFLISLHTSCVFRCSITYFCFEFLFDFSQENIVNYKLQSH